MASWIGLAFEGLDLGDIFAGFSFVFDSRFADQFVVMDCPPLFFEILAAHLTQSEADELLKLIENFESPDDVLLHVTILKDEGNLVFKKVMFRLLEGSMSKRLSYYPLFY